MKPIVDVYWSFRSPYSYLLTPRLRALAEAGRVEIRMRPVRPMAARAGDFFRQQNPQWVPYLLRDIQRVAAFLDLPIRWPQPDPVIVDPATLAGVETQPWLDLLMPLGLAAAETPQSLAFFDEVSRLIWGGTRDWHEEGRLDAAIAKAGLDRATLEKALDADAVSAAIARNEADQQAAGHWGVPLMVHDGEPFFGQDRFDLLVWRLQQVV